MVRFKVHPLQRDSKTTIRAEARLVDQRWVTSSTGRQTYRPVVATALQLMGQQWEIELTLVNRDAMGFRMLLGRQAVRGRFVVDPGKSFLAGPALAADRTKKVSRQRHHKKRATS